MIIDQIRVNYNYNLEILKTPYQYIQHFLIISIY